MANERNNKGHFVSKPAEAAPPVAPPEAPAPEVPAPGANDAPSTTPPERRGRGRPRKDGNEGAVPVPNESSAPKRGRPKKKDADLDPGLLAKQMQGLHLIAAQIMQFPAMQLRDEEAMMLSQSIVAVCDEYDLSMSGKTGALLQLLATAGIVYLPRAVEFKKHMLMQKAAMGVQINGPAVTAA